MSREPGARRERGGGLLATPMAALLGFVAGVVGVQTVAPDLLQGDPGRRVPSAVTARLVAAGDFRGMDSVRPADGRAQLLDAGDIQILRLVGLRVAPAPDLRVWLSRLPAEADPAGVPVAAVRPVAPLASPEGDQTYLLPAGLDLGQYRSVLIWCAEFNRPFAVAPLTR